MFLKYVPISKVTETVAAGVAQLEADEVAAVPVLVTVLVGMPVMNPSKAFTRTMVPVEGAAVEMVVRYAVESYEVSS